MSFSLFNRLPIEDWKMKEAIIRFSPKTPPSSSLLMAETVDIGPRPRYGMAGYGWWLVGRQHNGGQFMTYISDYFYSFTIWAGEEERT